jgi:3-oxosteroid 1-dehydrogenase
MMKRSSGWLWVGMRVVLRYLLDIPGRLKSMRSRCLTMGNALIGQLRWSMLDRDIELWLKSPMQSLIEENGEVIGAVIEKEGQSIRIRARKGVVIGAGGFEHNSQMRERWLPRPTNSIWSASQTNNTGDGIQAAMEIGAKTDMMEHAWWAPAIRVPGKDRPYAIFTERNLPGTVIVNKAGKRFENEAAPYSDGVVDMYRADSPNDQAIPAYVIFDASYRFRYPFGPVMPGYMLPDFLLFSVREVLVKARNLEELAEKIKVDADNLKETIRKNNEYAESGSDPEFYRGDSYYDRFNSDHRAKPNPCIGRIRKSPFYALPLYPGDLGTKGGILTDEHGRAINEVGEVINGLYVIGNSSASVMGSKDPGSGATLGPAMTFGYLAAKHMTKS